MLKNGVDIVEIKRFKNIKKTLLKKIFTLNELEYIKSKDNNIETIAGLYAAKEAILKCLGVSLNVFSLNEIEIIHLNGVPTVSLSSNIKKDLKEKNFSLSISHDGEYAIAFVIQY